MLTHLLIGSSPRGGRVRLLQALDIRSHLKDNFLGLTIELLFFPFLVRLIRSFDFPFAGARSRSSEDNGSSSARTLKCVIRYEWGLISKSHIIPPLGVFALHIDGPEERVAERVH